MKKVNSVFKYVFIFCFVFACFPLLRMQVAAGRKTNANESNSHIAMGTDINDNESFAPKVCKLNTLMYHHISVKQSSLNKFTISPSEFESDIKFLSDSGYHFVTCDDLIKFVHGNLPLPQKPIMVTFDDGYLSFKKYAVPILQKYKAKAVFSVIGVYADKYTKSKDTDINYSHCSFSDLKQLAETEEVEIQNHTYDMHCKAKREGTLQLKNETTAMYHQALTSDFMKMQETLKVECNVDATFFAYPFGYISDIGKQVVKECGFKGSLSCCEGVNIIKKNNAECLYNMKRYNRATGINFKNLLDRMNAKLV